MAPASVAISAYRHARRNFLDLPDIAGAVDAAIPGQFPGSQFATAVIGRLDIDTGRLRWINAGHPAPLIVRGASLVPLPPIRRSGRWVSRRSSRSATNRLEPGDRLLHTDGITEARSPDGEFFGEQRLADLVQRGHAAGDPAPETMRRLVRRVLSHQADLPQDDASIVVLEWLTGEEQRLPLWARRGPRRSCGDSSPLPAPGALRVATRRVGTGRRRLRWWPLRLGRSSVRVGRERGPSPHQCGCRSPLPAAGDSSSSSR